ncbi:thiamine pyrophosphate-binding protein [Pseudomonadota bacterium]
MVKKEVKETPNVVTYADLIISYLLQIDVEYIFGVPGGAIEPLYNALARNLRERPQIKPNIESSYYDKLIKIRKRNNINSIQPIIARHEAGAAYMADGYTRETGRLGVCCATTGPGATNLITGVASAYADRIPMLVITPQIALPNFGKLGLQESTSDAIDVVGMFKHCTTYNTLVSHPSQLESKLYTAIINAFSKPRGPAHISIPMDILKADIGADRTESYYLAPHLLRRQEIAACETFDALKQVIDESKKKILFLGGGCGPYDMEQILKYAELTNTPIVTTPSGKRTMDCYHPLYRGVFGLGGHYTANQTLMNKEVDLVLAVETSLGELSTCGWDQNLLNEKLIHISSITDDFVRSPMARLHIVGDSKKIFERLCSINSSKEKRTDLRFVDDKQPKETDNHEYLPSGYSLKCEEHLFSDSVPLKPQRVMYELSKRFPSDTRFFIDAGNAWAWATHYLMLKEDTKQFIGFGFGAMGWAIGAAIGAAFGAKDKHVTCITGDGSYLMSGQELSVAVAEKLQVVFIVLNDQALGMVKHGQRMGGAEPIAFQLPLVDYAKIAEAQGAQAYTIRKPEDFKKIDFKKLDSTIGPTLFDIHIDPEEVPPIDSRVNTLGNK